jgi:serine/threonine protein kinase
VAERLPDDTSWQLAEGDEIAPGRTVLKALGGGSRYEVLLVWDDVRFAIMVAKVLRPALVGDDEAIGDLQHEADALGALSHPVILRGFDAVLDGPHPHLLVEHLEGPTLRGLLRAEPRLPLQQLIPLGLHVAAGLAYLEAVGWVHLDLKPDNLIMGVPPRIIDLSIARTTERAARTRGVLGTDPYMAPEQCGTAEWEGRLGPATDVFGLAATLWRAATGEAPFPRSADARDSEDPNVRFPQLVAPPPEPPPGMPPALADLPCPRPRRPAVGPRLRRGLRAAARGASDQGPARTRPALAAHSAGASHFSSNNCRAALSHPGRTPLHTAPGGVLMPYRPADLFLSLHDDGPVVAATPMRRRLLALLFAVLLLAAVPLVLTTADAVATTGTKVTLSSDEDDNSGPGGGDDDNNSGPGNGRHDDDEFSPGARGLQHDLAHGNDDTRTQSRTATRTGRTGASTKQGTATQSRTATRTGRTGASTKQGTATQSRTATRTGKTGVSTKA